MKRIYFSLTAAMLLLVVGCNPFEDETSVPEIVTQDPTITPVATNDSCFTFKIDAPAGTGFFAWAVLKGLESEEINPTQLLANKLSDKNLVTQFSLDATMTLEAGEEQVIPIDDIHSCTIKGPQTSGLSAEVTINGLIPNTPYCIYAVSNSTQGTTGKVVAKQVLTTNHLVPGVKIDREKMEIIYKAVVDSATTDFTITFTEPIKKANFEGYAYYYRSHLAKPTDALYDSLKIEADSVNVDGTDAIIRVQNIPGAYCYITFKPGSFKNMVDSLSLGWAMREYDIKNPKKNLGIFERITPQEWDMVWMAENKKADTCLYFAKPSELALLYALDTAPGKVNFIDEKVDVQLVYHNLDKTTYAVPLTPKVHYKLAGGKAIALLPETPVADYATTIDIKFGKGAFQDEWGNPSNEYSREKTSMRLVTSTGFQGTYMIQNCESFFGNGEPINGALVEVEMKADSTFVIRNIHGQDDLFNQIEPTSLKPVIAKFNAKKDSLIVEAMQQIWVAPAFVFKTEDPVPMLFVPVKEGEEDLVPVDAMAFTMDKLGWLHNDYGYCVYIAGLGWFDGWDKNMSFIKIKDENPTGSKSAASSYQAPKMLNDLKVNKLKNKVRL